MTGSGCERYTLTRRRVVLAVGGALLTVGRSVRSQGARIPNPQNFRAGDFLWPKKPGAFVFYDYSAAADVESERSKWEAEKKHYLTSMRSGNKKNKSEIISVIEPLTYEEFRARYLRNLQFGQITPYGGGEIISIGHIAIVDIDEQGAPWVIEAILKEGVVRKPYQSWLAGRPGQIVWHGRIKGVDASMAKNIPTTAMRYLDRPYDFWNLDLSDAGGFYCSKLVWLSTIQAVDIALDKNTNPARSFWISPKQILYSSSIERLFDPGQYAVE